MEKLETLLRKHKVRLTAPRREVFQILSVREHPLSIGEIVILCKHTERTSVYRTLDLFAKLGVVDIIQIGWKQGYELSELFRAHHHHLTCTQCGEIIKIEQPKIEKILRNICEEYGYKETSHHVEINGICTRCRNIK